MSEQLTLAQRARARAASYDQRRMEKLLDQVRGSISKLSDEGKFECIFSINGDNYSESVVNGVIRFLRADGFEVEELFSALVGEVSKDIKIKINW